MIEYHVVTSHIFQPKHMLWVLKRTVGLRQYYQASNYNLNLMSLKKYALTTCRFDNFSEHVKLVELETLQVIVGSNGQNAYLEETMKSFQTEFYANASLSSTVLCSKHNIFMYSGEYLAKL